MEKFQTVWEKMPKNFRRFDSHCVVILPSPLRDAPCHTQHCRARRESCTGCRLWAPPRQRSKARQHWIELRPDWTQHEARHPHLDRVVSYDNCSELLAAPVGSHNVSITTPASSSMNQCLESHSKVIHFGGNRKPVYWYNFIQAVNSNFRSIFNCFVDTAGFLCPEQIFPYPTPIPDKIWGVLFGVVP